jgi:hypothetical protein
LDSTNKQGLPKEPRTSPSETNEGISELFSSNVYDTLSRVKFFSKEFVNIKRLSRHKLPDPILSMANETNRFSEDRGNSGNAINSVATNLIIKLVG